MVKGSLRKQGNLGGFRVASVRPQHDKGGSLRKRASLVIWSRGSPRKGATQSLGIANQSDTTSQPIKMPQVTGRAR